MKQKYVNVRSYMARTLVLLFVFIAGAFPTASVYAINTVQTDATLNGSATSIRVWGQIDSWTECSNDVGAPNDLTATMAGYGDYIQPHVVMENYQDNSGQIALPIGNEIQLGQYFDVTFTLDNIYELYATPNTPPTLYTGLTAPESIVYVSLQAMFQPGGGTSWDYRSDCMFLLGDWTNQVFTLLPGYVAPGGGGGVSPLRFSLMASTTEPGDLIASVAGGVQETGKAIWPMFAFVGVGLAFIIALQVVVFIKRSVNGGPGGTNGATGDPGASKRTQRRNSRGQFIKEE